LIPRNDWWVFTYNPKHPWATHWIDTSTPATFEEHRVTTIDLDLDVVRGPDGTVWIEDEDEFAEHQVVFGYPPALISNAMRATKEMERALIDLREPFASAPASWLARL
jgi:protein associated with RNAse G/E